jgi:hypothetical protein
MVLAGRAVRRCHPEAAHKNPANMRKDVLVFIVRRKETNDVAGAVADIEIVVFIQDDIFGRIDLAQTDQTNR